jgi:hypothetical protein
MKMRAFWDIVPGEPEISHIYLCLIQYDNFGFLVVKEKDKNHTLLETVHS